MMKTIVYILSLFLFMNCSREENNTYSKKDLIGNWNAYTTTESGRKVITKFLKTYFTGITFNQADTFQLFADYENEGEISSFSNITDPNWEVKDDALFLYGALPHSPYEDYGLMESFKIKEITEDRLTLIDGDVEFKLQRLKIHLKN